MELEFELTEEDYINYNIAHAKKSPSIKKRILFQRIFGPIIFTNELRTPVASAVG